ncbi:MAG TPA: hypothetical protein VIU61_12975 [Kofleriaceae bacterium]
MRRLVVLVVVVACGDATQEAQPPQLVSPAPVAPAAALQLAPPPVKPAQPPEFRPQRLMSGGHGQAIASIALSEDGRAAVTIDTANRVRLWPALDASRDPWVVPLVAPNRVAIQRDGDTFVLGTLDAAGGIVVQRIAEPGTLVGQVGFEPAFDELVAATGGFLAIRSDQTIVKLDLHGKQIASIRAEPGQRVMALANRKGKTLAMLASRDGVHGRWLTDALAWGETTPVMAIEPATTVLSPAHTHLAAIHAKSKRPVIVDLATGRATELWNPRWEQEAASMPLGFVTADRVAVQHTDFELSTISWWDLRGYLRGEQGTDFELEFVSVRDGAAGDDRVAAFVDMEVVLVAPASVKYLGYRVTSANRVRATPGGLVAGIAGTPTLLDDAFRATRRLIVPALTPRGWSDVFLLEADRAIVISDAVAGRFGEEWLDETLVKRQARPPRFELVDLVAKKKLQTLPFAPRGNRIVFEPTTQLLATRGGSQVLLARLDPAGTFGAIATIAVDAPVREVALVDPARAGGVVAIVVASVRGGIKLWRIRGDEVVAGSTFRAGEPVALTGELDAIDRAGNVYLRESPDVVAIHAPDREPVKIGDLKAGKLRPSPDGTRIAVFGRGRITLYGSDGKELWAIAVPGVTDVQWSSTGEIVVTARGLASVDAATGQLIAGQCGWGLALRSAAPVDFVAAPSLCDR